MSMHGLKVPLTDAEYWKKKLLDEGLFATDYQIQKDDKHIYYPLKKKFTLEKSAHAKSATIIERNFISLTRKKNLKSSLANHLSEKELVIVKTAHDVIGTIAIIEVPRDLTHKAVAIANAFLATNPQIKTVLKKADSHDGVYRTQKMEYLAGINTKESLYKENGVQLKVDVEKVYFSVRLSTERKRIAGLVKSGEDILVMFSGAAPYPVVLAKNTKAKHILGIEINPEGHKYGLENVKLNKCKNIDLVCGDVHDVIPELLKKNSALTFDRIIMPLPKTADEFLSDALRVAKKGTIIHFYDFLDEKIFDEAKEKINIACTKANVSYRILRLVKCGQHAPHVFRICVDFETV
ncbi:MAG: class I SAM-dependent methyltransferase family protein [Candidatus Woesearchaeota archaeon]